MRLAKIDTGHTWSQKVLLRVISFLSRSEPMDVVKVFMYRPAFFGKPFCRLGHIALRGPSPWSIGERELFGAFTSSLNACVF